ncbi:MAG: hypothetical protein UX89_C0008G0046 [Parcubacteria group bacterium GW2011_GWA2_47_16]|nr:MAG: hypothetical protein UX89_C0008G0046 [Parcubacteria group bacterium GW2011_GWA2_47_16]
MIRKKINSISDYTLHPSPYNPLKPLSNPAFASVWIEFNGNLVADEHPNTVQSHLAGQKTKYFVLLIFQFNLKHGVGQCFHHNAKNRCFLFLLVIHL